MIWCADWSGSSLMAVTGATFIASGPGRRMAGGLAGIDGVDLVHNCRVESGHRRIHVRAFDGGICQVEVDPVREVPDRRLLRRLLDPVLQVRRILGNQVVQLHVADVAQQADRNAGQACLDGVDAVAVKDLAAAQLDALD